MISEISFDASSSEGQDIVTPHSEAESIAAPMSPQSAPELNERVETLELQVRELSQVILSTCGIERAWQIATLALLGNAASSPELCKYLSKTLEETRQGMVEDGVAQAYADGYCMTARLILETAYKIDQRPAAPSEAH